MAGSRMSKRSHNNSPLRSLSLQRVRGSRGPSARTVKHHYRQVEMNESMVNDEVCQSPFNILNATAKNQ